MKSSHSPFIIHFSEMDNEDVPKVGGKNSSLGEMIKHLKPLGVSIPDGFATTSDAYRFFLKSNKLEDQIESILNSYYAEKIDLNEAGRSIRQLFKSSTFPISLAESIRQAYYELSRKFIPDMCDDPKKFCVDVAVRSSATAEDLPNASFAGQQETYLNVHGVENLMNACKNSFASLFTNRAIVYRQKMGFDHMQVALSVGVQKMVRADKGCSGVMFTVDTETGFPNALIINGSWGLGENVVKGTVNPDRFCVFKPQLGNREKNPVLERVLGSKEVKMIYASDEGNSTVNIPTSITERQSFVLNNDEVLQLSRWGVAIEKHYGRAMDIEWVKDDLSGNLFIVQARPETIHSINMNGAFRNYSLKEKSPKLLFTGVSIGNTIASGRVKIVHDTTDLSGIDKETILVTEITEPDWGPALRNVAGIVTNFGGPTCHAAIISRELGIPAVVGTEKATKVLQEGDEITVSSAEGEVGKIYSGRVDFEIEEIDSGSLPKTITSVMLNLATPESAFKWWKMPVRGVGLARMEEIINNYIRIHPMALVHPDRISDEDEFRKIRKLTAGYSDLKAWFIDQIASGVSKIAASQYPLPVIIRTSDFKTSDYVSLIGGSCFEPYEENPMLGLRGASRYYSDDYRDGFELECRALNKVRDEIGLVNLIVMIPFCRTLHEAEKVLSLMAEYGLKKGENGLQIYMMCEVPSNYILAEQFAEYFDGFSIGSNDLTQLILGVDRDSESMTHLFDENDTAVKTAIREVIERVHKAGIKVGFCGQAASENPDYTTFLVECGIDFISVVPHSAVHVIQKVAEAEMKVDVEVV